MKTYFAEQLFDGQRMHNDMHMRVENGKIVAIQSASESPWLADAKLMGLVSAGFIDTQVNGGGGRLFNHQPRLETLKCMVRAHAGYGTTAMLPTLISDSSETMQEAADAVSEAIDIVLPGIVGIHFEGPHLSLVKKGIHPGQQVRPINDADLAIITRKDIGKVFVTVAPESVSEDIIAELTQQGVVVSLGHSGADIDSVLKAIDAGATCFTHLYNAMSGLSARQPGLISAALNDERACAGIIADLQHVHPENCRLAYKCLGSERLMLVTDAMAHVGCDLQTLPWLDSVITRANDKLTLADGSLAGSCLDMAGAVKNMYQVLSRGYADEHKHVLLCDVLNMASQTPANVLGLSDRGQLKIGHQADFVLLDKDLQAQACWINGMQVAGTN